MQTIWIIDDDAAIGDLEQELLERAASSLGCVYTCGRLSLDTASHTVLAEPVNGLDPEGIIEIRELILKLNREHGITVLISSHILDELAKLATHYGFIDSGRIVRELSADELESASRKCLQLTVSDTCQVLLSDTVGFIAKLPHHLVNAFRATLEELEYADLLIHVIDSADPEREDHIAVVNRLIAELAKPGTPVLECYNKCDLVPDDEIPRGTDKVAISAAQGAGIDALKKAIEAQLGKGKHQIRLLLPYAMGGMVETLHSGAKVLGCEYAGEGIFVDAVVDETLFGKLRPYVIEET